MTQNFISNVSIQFEYFDIQLDHPDWMDKKVMDFGGNVGNILSDPECKIKESNYWCLDVSRDVIEKGQNRYPLAHFEFYDSYNFSYNPSGIVNLEIPDVGERFDYILAYSIFTHMDIPEVISKVNQLKAFLADDGVLIFTFLAPDYNASHYYSDFQNITNLEKRLMRLNDGVLDSGLIDRSRGAEKIILINNKDLYINDETYFHSHRKEGDTFFSFFAPEYLKALFNCKIKLPPSQPYDNYYPAEMQHSCILKKN